MSYPTRYEDAVVDALRKLNSDHIVTGTAAGDVQTLILAVREQAFREVGLIQTPTHQHVKSGGLYREEARGHLQTDAPTGDNARLVAYRGADGRLWFRPTAEFDDAARFKPMPAQAPDEHIIIDHVECGCGVLHTKTAAGWAVTRPVTEAEADAINAALQITRPTAAWPFPTPKDRT